MDFYTMLSRYYDEIFPLDTDCLSFVREHCGPGMTLMDAGCGSGALVRRLRKEGVDARGFDLDSSMIDLARKGLAEDGITGALSPEEIFRTGDLADTDLFCGDKEYDVITCLGNTLVHIDFPGQIRFLGKVCSALKPGGLLVLQILNYMNIREEGQGFPVLEGENSRFIREYRRSDDERRLFFHTSLEDKRSGECYCNSVTHYPLLPEALMALLSMNAFAEWETYGDWDGSAAGSGQPALIVAARSEQ